MSKAAAFANYQDVKVGGCQTVHDVALRSAPPASRLRVFTAKLPVSGKEFLGRERELEILDNAWSSGQTTIISLEALGGVGKSTLVNYWLNQLAMDNFRGAARVYGWSFYSQGASEDRQASADEFFEYTLKWFGVPDPNIGAPWEKGVRLASLIRRARTLLILDGLESLQHPSGEMHGNLNDQGLKTLLKELAISNDGLCVITTRTRVRDLDNFVGYSVQRVSLENLSPTSAAMLLKDLGVKGAADEIRKVAMEFDCHALALNLLGRYLAVVHGGDIRKMDWIPKLEKEQRKGGHARRVMESYERWLAGKPEISILYMMGLFDRPAKQGAIQALRTDPPIRNLTTDLNDLSIYQWKFALQNLRDLRLLSTVEENLPDHREAPLDCHPMVREHFCQKFKRENPEAWKEAHGRLYEYYRDLPEKEFPDTLEEMGPLFMAVAHGCQAKRRQEVLEDVYEKRILRGDQFYSTRRLGAFGSDLAALSNFFHIPWSEPSPDLPKSSKAGVLNLAGIRLRALGRLREAVQPLQAGLEARLEQNDIEDAARISKNLIELYLTTGDIRSAISYGRKGVAIADRAGESFLRIIMRTALATALHQAGKWVEAEDLYNSAEALQKDYQHGYPYLYSLQGYQYCEFLLDQGKFDQAQKRALKFLEWRQSSDPLLDTALDHLSMGRASLLKARCKGGKDWTRVETRLDQAVEGLRQAGVREFLVSGLLARVEFYRLTQNFISAWKGVNEATEIADVGSMKLHLADCCLEKVRLYLAEEQNDKALLLIPSVKTMIDEMGFHRRDDELVKLYLTIGAPDEPEAWKQLASFVKHLLERGKLDDATQLLDVCIKRCKRQNNITEAVNLFLIRARVRFKMKAYDQSRWDYKKVLSLCKELGMDDRFTEVEAELGELEYRSGLMRDARSHLEHAALHLSKGGNKRQKERINILLSEFRRFATN